MDSAAAPSSVAAEPGPDVHHSIGALTRQLHDALQALGLTDKFRGLAGELPDAQDRLSYISRLTGEAAEKVLNRVDLAKADHDHVLTASQALGQRLLAGGRRRRPHRNCSAFWPALKRRPARRMST